MKPIKLFFLGKRLRDIYPHATRWQVLKWKVRRLFRKLFICSIIGSVVYGGFLIGTKSSKKVVYRVAEAKNIIIEKERESPVLERISKCESGNSHYDKSGQVIFNTNTNGSVDVGKYQINTSIWGAKATELGYDLTKEKDNEAMAKWIYANKGTEPWFPSKNCWNK